MERNRISDVTMKQGKDLSLSFKEKIELANGDVVIVTGNGKGNLVRYTFA